METKFKVVMRRDDEAMKDFLSFRYRAQGQANRAKLYIFAIGMLAIGYFAAKGGNVTMGNIIAVVGILMVLSGFVLPKVALARLKKMDEAYQAKKEFTYVFARGSMYVYENDELSQNIGSYRQVSCFYEDEKNFYVGINNDDLYVLPRVGFVEGDSSEFVEFIQDVSDEKCIYLPATLKNRWKKFRADQKIKEMEHDAKAAEKRAEAKAKRNKKNK